MVKSKKKNTKAMLNRMVAKEARILNKAIGIVKAKTSHAKKAKLNQQYLANGLESLVDSLGYNYTAPQINRTGTLELNLRRQPLTFDRPTLNYLYQEYGIIRAAIDMPVDDALRGGVTVKTDELSPEDIQELTDSLDRDGIYETIKTTMKWTELFGGAGIVVNNGQDPATRLDLKSMTEDSPLAFYDADRWELGMPNKSQKPDGTDETITNYYFYYTHKIHRSRVLGLRGDTAPSLTRRMLMGWGLSKVEKMVRDLNQFIKAQDVIFELLDEAKIDVYKIEGYKSGLATPEGEARIVQAIGLTNSTKNFLNSLVLDKDDEYIQKQLSFAGLGDMLREIKIGIAATLRMPADKLFGKSATGFASGEDTMENYNAMIESDIRARLRPVIREVIGICCIKLFGFIPNFSFEFQSLRMMSQNDEAELKTKKQLMILNNYDRGALTMKEMMEAQRVEGLLSIEKTAAEQGLTEDFPKPPVQKVTQTIKADDNPAEQDNGKSDEE